MFYSGVILLLDYEVIFSYVFVGIRRRRKDDPRTVSNQKCWKTGLCTQYVIVYLPCP